MQVDVVVLGAGPGGYTAAFRAADLGQSVALVERSPELGGVCLNVGCIPSKTLLHAAKLINDVGEMAAHGVSFGTPTIDTAGLANWKSSVIGKLTGGLRSLAKQRNITVVHGSGRFLSPTVLQVATADDQQEITFKSAIVAAGSEPVTVADFPHEDPRLIDSTGALALADIPPRLLVIGGGIIGLEMATVYAALGSAVTVVELLDGLMTGTDRDLVRPLQKRLSAQLAAIHTATRVSRLEPNSRALRATFEGESVPPSADFDKVLLAVGRRPNGHHLGLENTGVVVDERGFIPVDKQQRTNIKNIYAIGDVVGQPMLAHKATHEAKVAAEVIAGHKVAFDTTMIPSVAYTDPEIAWVGLTETQARAEQRDYEKSQFPWAASGRALSLGRSEGLTKLLFDPDDGRVLGAGIVGPNAGDLIAEATLAIEMGCDAHDISLTIHPHPTLSETVAMAAEVHAGTITDLYMPRKK